jgi:hypothetical protein
MTTTADATNVHDFALDTFRHLKGLENSPERTPHVFHMVCALERAAAGSLDDAGTQDALKDIESAAQF